MFNLDIDKLAEEDAKREQLKKDYGDVSPEEAELLRMREGYLKQEADITGKSLEKLDERINELSDDGTIIADDIKKAAEKFDEENKSTEEISEDEEKNTEEETEEIQEEEEVEENTADVESEAKKEVNEDWLKEKQELEKAMREKDELLMKMYQELQTRQQSTETKTEEVKEPVKAKSNINKDDIKTKVKEAFEKMSYADEEAASDILTETIMSLASQKTEDQSDVEARLEALLAKKEQEKAEKMFETAKESFFNSEAGKKVLADEDMFDLYKVKFDRLQKSGKHLNPEGLFEEAYKLVSGASSKTDSSTAKKATPKVSDSLKEDVSKVEETKKQAVKPAGSSGSTQTTANKKFDATEAWKELQRQMGQEI